jgi:uncharacterized Zn finger protein (UPF0148 family)
MSDFDKEKEREKLREKYGDEGDREATQRMSDLLLKGATMTNRHCSDCGDPIFRYDGQAFCPTCQEPVGTADEDAVAADAEGDARGGTDAAADGSTDGTTADGTSEGGTPDPEPVAATGDTDRTPRERADPRTTPDPDPAAETPDPPEVASEARADREPTAETRRATERPALSTDAGGLGAAAASLTRQVAALAARAEEADDLRRQRDLLAAAGEAAEALAAVRQA